MADDLDRLCEAYGIALSYHDIWGNEHATPEATKRALLDAMHAGDASPDDLAPAMTRTRQCHMPPPGARWFGPAIQLYALRSRRNWGIGDFTDLANVARHAAAEGASLVGVNPLHELFLDRPEQASPYSPSSRLALNPLYLDVEAIDDFDAMRTKRARWSPSDAFAARLAALRSAPLVDHAGVWSGKREALALLFAHFRERELDAMSARAREFRAFVHEQRRRARRRDVRCAAGQVRACGAGLRGRRRTAITAHDAVRGRRTRIASISFSTCSGRPTSSFVARIGRARCGHVHRPVPRPRRRCQPRRRGDVAAPAPLCDAARTWALRRTTSIAPGRTGDCRRGSRTSCAKPGMRHGMRFCAPTCGMPARCASITSWDWRACTGYPRACRATEGAYVSYPVDDLCAVLADESQRQRAIVVGEDLGTVPDALRGTLRDTGVLSYRVLYFERTPDGGFKRPDEYPPQALVCVSTHDLPTLKGFFEGTDLAHREALGLLPDDDLRDRLRAERDRRLRGSFARSDAQRRLSRGVDESSRSHRYVARTPCALMTVQLEDVFGETEQANLPATMDDQHPNWRRKVGVDLEDWARDGRFAQRLRRDPRAKGAARTLMPRERRRHSARDLSRAAAQGSSRSTMRAGSCRISRRSASATSTRRRSCKARAGSTHGYDVVDHEALNPEIGSEADFDALTATLREHGMRPDARPRAQSHGRARRPTTRGGSTCSSTGRLRATRDYFDIDWAPADETLAGKVLVRSWAINTARCSSAARSRCASTPGAASFRCGTTSTGCRSDPPSTRASLLARPAPRPGATSRTPFAASHVAFAAVPMRPEREARRDARSAPRREGGARRDSCASMPAVARLDRRERRRDQRRRRATRAASTRSTTAGGAGLPPRVLARRRRRHQLPPLLRHQRSRRPACRARGRLRGDASARHGARREWKGATACASTIPTASPIPAQYFVRLQAAACECLAQRARRHGARSLRRGREDPGLARAACRTPGPYTATRVTASCAKSMRCSSIPAPQSRFDRAVCRLHRRTLDFDGVLRRAKTHIVVQSLASDLNRLATALTRIVKRDRHTRDFSWNAIRRALVEVVAAFPVYRTYVTQSTRSAEDERYVDWAIAVAKRHGAAADTSVFDFIGAVLRGEYGKPTQSAAQRGDELRRCASSSGARPRWRKGSRTRRSTSTTGSCRSTRSAAIPALFGSTVGAFHRACRHARARLAAFDARLLDARQQAKRGRARAHRRPVGDARRVAPRACAAGGSSTAGIAAKSTAMTRRRAMTSTCFYQTLVGAWPLGKVDASERSTHSACASRRTCRRRCAKRRWHELGQRQRRLTRRRLRGSSTGRWEALREIPSSTISCRSRNASRSRAASTASRRRR